MLLNEIIFKNLRTAPATFSLAFSLVTFGAFAQIDMTELLVKSDIDEVKLYLTSGEMMHEESLKLKKGRNRIQFTGISAFADPQSIQFDCSAAYRLVSVSTEMDFLAAENVNPRIKSLKDSLEFLTDQLQFTQDQISSYAAEESMLAANRDLGGESQNLSVQALSEAAVFYRERTLSIKRKIAELRKQERAYNLDIENTRYQLVELNYNENQRSNQIIIIIDLEQNAETDVQVKYLVSDCGWAATYDLSAEDINGKINLKYNAQVYNNTGNNWEGVKLRLSTADPKLSASVPRLDTWYLNRYSSGLSEGNKYYAPLNYQEDYRQVAASDLSLANQRAWDNYYTVDGLQKNVQLENGFKLESRKSIGNNGVLIKEIQISELTTEFEIEHTFFCPSDARPYLVLVKEEVLDATFSHITVPKLDRSAFLIAHIVGWQELDLIPGPTNVYFSGRYVGVSEIDVHNVSDTLSLSFGRDDQVTVMRKLKKEMSSKSVMGNFKKESYQYGITVRNNRDTPIRLEIYDQIPISTNDDITVLEDNISGGSKDSETGEVVWKSVIDSGSTIGKDLGYTVKYPKSVRVAMATFRTISCPAF